MLDSLGKQIYNTVSPEEESKKVNVKDERRGVEEVEWSIERESEAYICSHSACAPLHWHRRKVVAVLAIIALGSLRCGRARAWLRQDMRC